MSNQVPSPKTNQISYQQSQQQQQVRNPLFDEMKNYCKSLWKINLPPKIKNFWWRALHWWREFYDGFYVAQNMKKRGIHVDPNCQICGEKDETVDHIRFHFRILKEIQSLMPSLFQTHRQNNQICSKMLIKEENRNLMNFFCRIEALEDEEYIDF